MVWVLRYCTAPEDHDCGGYGRVEALLLMHARFCAWLLDVMVAIRLR